LSSLSTTYILLTLYKVQTTIHIYFGEQVHNRKVVW